MIRRNDETASRDGYNGSNKILLLLLFVVVLAFTSNADGADGTE